MPNSLQLKALGMEGMINELLRYLRLAENPLSSAYSFLAAPIYNIVLHSLVDAREVSVLNYSFFPVFRGLLCPYLYCFLLY